MESFLRFIRSMYANYYTVHRLKEDGVVKSSRFNSRLLFASIKRLAAKSEVLLHMSAQRGLNFLYPHHKFYKLFIWHFFNKQTGCVITFRRYFHVKKFEATSFQRAVLEFFLMQRSSDLSSKNQI